MPERIAVMQVTDSLVLGGAERVAVNLANLLPRDRYQVHLCVTREEGPLAAEIAPDVARLVLERPRRRDDLAAAWRLARYIRQHDIRLLHAHKATNFLCSLAKLMDARAPMIWHDHWGGFLDRPVWIHRIGTRAVDAIISVSVPLREWAIEKLHFPPERVVYIPNFVKRPAIASVLPRLPGEPGFRVVCVARVDPQKDLSNFVRALARVREREPRAHGLVVGDEVEGDYGESVREEARGLGLGEHLHWLGPRTDVTDILQACDVGVLSSRNEGLPLALVEYGLCRLPSVATRVGQCADVLDDGRAGILVPREDPEALADGITRLLASPEERARLAELAFRHAEAHHTAEAALGQVTALYDTVLARER
jgi:glycosyltransferase involved in cell wall biosynthesis